MISGKSRNWIALLGISVAAWLVIFILRAGLIQLGYRYNGPTLGPLLLTLLWLLPDLLTYFFSGIALQWAIAEMRKLRWVMLFGAVGTLVKLIASMWILIDGFTWAPSLMLFMQPFPPHVLSIAAEVLAPLAGSWIGWVVWRRIALAHDPATA